MGKEILTFGNIETEKKKIIVKQDLFRLLISIILWIL